MKIDYFTSALTVTALPLRTISSADRDCIRDISLPVWKTLRHHSSTNWICCSVEKRRAEWGWEAVARMWHILAARVASFDGTVFMALKRFLSRPCGRWKSVMRKTGVAHVKINLPGSPRQTTFCNLIHRARQKLDSIYLYFRNAGGRYWRVGNLADQNPGRLKAFYCSKIEKMLCDEHSHGFVLVDRLSDDVILLDSQPHSFDLLPYWSLFGSGGSFKFLTR